MIPPPFPARRLTSLSEQLAALIQTLKSVKKEAVPWVDGTRLPWEDLDFSRRFATKVDYTALFGHPSTGAQVDVLQKELGLRTGDTVIDLCCGPGPHSIELAKRGFHVIGIDVGTGAIEIARQRAAGCPNGEPIFVIGDVCSGSTWDEVVSSLAGRRAAAAFMIRSQIDNFRPPELAVLVGHLRAVVSPGGRLLLEFTEPHKADKTCKRSWSVWNADTNIWADSDCLVLSDRRWDADRQAAIDRYWVLHPDGRIAEYATCQQCYERLHITRLLQAEGWAPVRFMPGDSTGTRLVAVRSGR